MHTGTFQKLSGALQRVLLGVDFVSDTAQAVVLLAAQRARSCGPAVLRSRRVRAPTREGSPLPASRSSWGFPASRGPKGPRAQGPCRAIGRRGRRGPCRARCAARRGAGRREAVDDPRAALGDPGAADPGLELPGPEASESCAGFEEMRERERGRRGRRERREREKEK